jgi:hypothetical protein
MFLHNTYFIRQFLVFVLFVGYYFVFCVYYYYYYCSYSIKNSYISSSDSGGGGGDKNFTLAVCAVKFNVSLKVYLSDCPHEKSFKDYVKLF